MQDLEIRTEEINGVVIVRCEGELNTYNTEMIRSLIAEILKENNRIVIDLCKIEYFDSTGLSGLVACKKRINDTFGQLALINDRPKTNRIFKVTGLDQKFFITADQNKAIKTVTNNSLS